MVETPDTAGMTRGEVSALPLEEQFSLYGARYQRIRDLLTGAQLRISEGEWRWIGEATAPSSGLVSPTTMPGVSGANCYFLDTARITEATGTRGAIAHAEAMAGYAEARRWATTVMAYDGDVFVRATTADGDQLDYTITTAGSHILNVYSGLYWGDYRGLRSAITDRVPDDAVLAASVPGVFVPFPAWGDPVGPGRDPLYRPSA